MVGHRFLGITKIIITCIFSISRVDETQQVLTIKQNMSADFIGRNVMDLKKNVTTQNWTLAPEALVDEYVPEQDKILNEAIAKEQFTIRLYSVVMILSIVFVTIQTYAIFDYCRRASVNIHKSMVKNIINATMAFFDTHFIGNVLNRFSQDMNNIDEQVPFTMREFIRVSYFNILIIVK